MVGRKTTTLLTVERRGFGDLIFLVSDEFRVVFSVFTLVIGPRVGANRADQSAASGLIPG